jgi:hypothetical protein
MMRYTHAIGRVEALLSAGGLSMENIAADIPEDGENDEAIYVRLTVRVPKPEPVEYSD